jgi:hypothetical protein
VLTTQEQADWTNYLSKSDLLRFWAWPIVGARRVCGGGDVVRVMWMSALFVPKRKILITHCLGEELLCLGPGGQCDS